MKKLAIIVFILVLAALALPLSNLVVGPPSVKLAAQAPEGDGQFAKAVAILEGKCVNCHTSEGKIPFYANFPIAKGIIQEDIDLGTQYVDYAEAFATDGGPVSEVVLAKTEYALEQGTMPPHQYLMLHWNGGLSGEEKQTILDWIKQTRVKHYAPEGHPPEVQERVIQPLPQSHNEDPKKVALGDKLYHDKRLSTDNSLACAGCHGLDLGGTDQKQFSEGVGGAVGGINAPTTLNSGFQFLQFWDGRAADLEEQAAGPVSNPIEMASNWEEAIPKLEQDAAFTAAFKEAYPGGYSEKTITSAIATFERALITPNSRFDKYLAGDGSALNENERKGYELFLANSCATCHVGQAMGGQSFELMGRKADYFGDRGNLTEADDGRYNVTKDEADRHKLKVPTLRNIALTFPYLHDGSTSDLKEVVNIMAKYEVGTTLSDKEADQIVAFLNTLTGELNGKLLQ